MRRFLSRKPASALPRGGAGSALRAGWVALALAAPLDGAPGLSFDAERFHADLEALTRHENRLPGSEGSRRAADYLEERLAASGLDEVERLSFETWHLRVERAELRVGGDTLPLHPLRPNVTVPPVTPEEGVAGPLLYAGRGDIADYGSRDPEGAVVLLDYAAAENWERAFALGARAVVLLGEPGDRPAAPVHLNAPANFLRFYMDRASLPLEPGAYEGREVRLFSEVHWEPAVDRVLAGLVRGTEASSGETVVIATGYDSFGNVPTRSPGARRAANAALLLQYAEAFAQHPPRRNVLFVFTGSRAYNHQGARYFYEALGIEESKLRNLLESLKSEEAGLEVSRRLLREAGLRADTDVPGGALLHRLMADEAQFMHDDLSAEIARIRLRAGAEEEAGPETESLKRALLRKSRIDDLRRALFNRELAALIENFEASGRWPPKKKEDGEGGAAAAAEPSPGTEPGGQLLDELRAATARRLEARLAEIERELRYWRNAETLRETVGIGGGSGAVRLHLTLNLGDASPRWGLAPSDDLERLLDLPEVRGADEPGAYVRLFSQIKEWAQGREELARLDERSLSDPYYGSTFAGAPHTGSGRAAGLYGIHNVTLLTENDARLRDGHPSDTVEALDTERLLGQGREVLTLLGGILNFDRLATSQPLKALAQSKYPQWRNGRAWGDFASRTVIGGLAETRPAESALLAHWATSASQAQSHWNELEATETFRDFTPFSLSRANAFGRFPIIGHRGVKGRLALFGALFGEDGRVSAVSDQSSQIPPRFAASLRLSLFPARGHALMTNPVHRTSAAALSILKGSTNFTFNPERVLWGVYDNAVFAYLALRESDGGLKVFQPMGAVVMAERGEDPVEGGGVPAEKLRSPPQVSKFSADNLWRLNESRLSDMRSRGVSRADLERLHSRALAAYEQVDEAAGTPEKEALRLSSASLSHRIYQPLRASMDDLVNAIVILLLLTLPFAFAMERLLVGATTIYGRLIGFCVFFILTFGLLYFLHPGFAVSSAPMIIFLAFAVLGLSAMVIQMLLRRFKQELRAIQGQGGQGVAAEVSRAGTMLAAVGMGISTMRRRPTRTLLTSVTVVMLTFTILSFASFSRELGVDAHYLGPAPEGQPDGILVRELTHAPLPDGLGDMLGRFAGDDAILAEQWWLSREDAASPGLLLTNPENGRSVELQALLGLESGEARHWPALGRLGDADAAASGKSLREGEILLPRHVMGGLALEAGDRVDLRGRAFTVAGALDIDELQLLRGIDLESILPVDTRQSEQNASGEEQAQSTELGSEAVVEQNFVRVGAGEIAVTSAADVEAQGGSLQRLTLYPSEAVDTAALGRDLAALVSTPVWAAGPGGVERLVLTVLTEVSGAMAVAVPLLLGGLIIFGTLLGSISDREKEIYTFSALGLGPGHVGMLFFAEAGVYAVIGGMGGQLIAQIVAYAASTLAARGLIDPVTINFSSTNSLFAIGVVMLVVLLSSLYPAYRASKSANPGLAREWKMPRPEGDTIDLTFPFTVSSYDITGVVSFLAGHLRGFDDAGLGKFATTSAVIRRDAEGHLELVAEVALAPFDLGVTEVMELSAQPSEIPGVDEVRMRIRRLSGTRADWERGTRVFLKELRKQFLVWRTLSSDVIESYRLKTLSELGEDGNAAANTDPRSQ